MFTTVQVQVIRSPRRRKTVEARQVGDVLRVSIPANMTRVDEEHWVAEMLRRARRREETKTIDIEERACALARRFGLPVPASARWVDNQRWRWGSCTPEDRSVRISNRLAGLPAWVLDYVVVHELAHIAIASHDESFWELVNRYPRAERARGYLIAKGEDDSECDD